MDQKDSRPIEEHDSFRIGPGTIVDIITRENEEEAVGHFILGENESINFLADFIRPNELGVPTTYHPVFCDPRRLIFRVRQVIT